jgi:type I restriction enzyme M protein
LTDDSSEIECLFIERAKQLLKPGGWAGIILPSSILSNSGIYTDAREIILKYFSIKAITEFGSNTFMATGTNTITMFLERRRNNEWKKIEQSIKNFFNRPRESSVNGIENAFSKYVSEVFEGLKLSDYITLVNKSPNDVFKKQELFKEYKNWFDNLTEVVQLKDKKIFKEKSLHQQQAELDKLFYEKVFAREQEKILYYFLAYPQQIILIKVGEKQHEKDFLGYEFSNRRGHEGIKMYRDENGKLTTVLYDDENKLIPEKVNWYVHKIFLNENVAIPSNLQGNVVLFNMLDLMNFRKIIFDKSVTMGVKKKIQIKSKWKLVKLGSICELNYGISLPESKRKKGKYPVLGSNGRVGFHNEYLIKSPAIIIGRKGSVGKVVWENKNCTPIDTTFYITLLNKEVELKYLHIQLKELNLPELKSGLGVPGLNRNDVYSLEIPLPEKQIQTKICNEIKIIEEKEIKNNEFINNIREKMLTLYNTEKRKYEIKKITNYIEIIGGGTPSTNEMSYWNGEIPWLSVVDFNNDSRYVNSTEKKITEKGLKNSSTKLLNEGDVIISARGTVGAIAQLSIPMTFNQSCYGLRGKEGFDNGYLYYVLKYEIQQLKDNSSGAIFDAITTKSFESIYIPVPSYEVQKKIVKKFEKYENKINQIKKYLDGIDERKRKILKKYLE